MKKACITGITGQTGSYLAELLLDKGYEVHGLMRRSSSFNTGRIDHIFDKLHLVHGDLSDYSSLANWISSVKPDEFYNLGAQSHVKVSFDIPEYTMDIDGTGVVRCLEAIRHHSPQTKFLQASTSELWGGFNPPQNEESPFYPRSPYGIAKLAAYWATVNYREAYNIFGINSISLNHECIGEKTPIIIKKNDVVDVCSAASLIPLLRKGKSSQSFEIKDIDVWDGTSWTPLKTITATFRRKTDLDHRVIFIEGRGGVVNCTSHHTMIREDGTECRADNLNIEEKILMGEMPPKLFEWGSLTKEMAEFLGLIVAEGCVCDGHVRFTNQDIKLLDRVKHLWKVLFIGTSNSTQHASGFKNGKPVTQLDLNGCPSIGRWINDQIYDQRTRLKKVPTIILNSECEIKKAFVAGYYAGDGLKAGSGNSISIKTNSPILAQGLCLLYYSFGNKSSVYVEHRGAHDYYQLNILKDNGSGSHWKKDPCEIRKISEDQAPDDWVFDLETGSGVFCAGVGRAVVHNSQRRGETFVTRKITRAAARIKFGLQNKLVLGNLSAKRDWNHAKDIAEAMMLMMNAPKADNWVVASGEMHSVKEFAELVFKKLDLDYNQYVETDPKYLRPTEVEELCGDSTKIRTQLGWKPKYNFEQLVDEMIENDLRLAREEKLIRG